MLAISSVGVIGLGPVGGTVARRLLDHGLHVIVYDPDAPTVETMAAAGATPARIPADGAEQADLVFVHLHDEAAVEEALFDCGGVGDTLPDGRFVVTASVTGPAMSPTDAQSTRKLAPVPARTSCSGIYTSTVANGLSATGCLR